MRQLAAPGHSKLSGEITLGSTTASIAKSDIDSTPAPIPISIWRALMEFAMLITA
jgi:hypothetical protein